MGNVISLPLSGFLCVNGFGGGWPSVFYVIGISSAIWLVMWIALVSDSPAKHWRISDLERDYIMKSLKGQVSEENSKVMAGTIDHSLELAFQSQLSSLYQGSSIKECSFISFLWFSLVY